MTGRWPEHHEQDEVLEDKRKKVDGFDSLDVAEKKAFDSLDFSHAKWKDKYDEKDIEGAISSTVQKWINDAWFPPDSQWKRDAQKIQAELLNAMKGKTPQEMIKEYAKFRTELISVLAAPWAQWKSDLQKHSQIQQEEQRNNDATFDFFQKARDFWKLLTEQSDKRQEERQRRSQEIKEKSWKEQRGSQEQAFEALSRWPK